MIEEIRTLELPQFSNGGHTVGAIVGNYPIRSLNVNDDVSRILLPDFVSRCVSFLTKYHVEMDATWLSNTIYANFQAGPRDALMLVAVDSDMKIVAHCFCIIQLMGTEPVCYCLQVENDTKNRLLIIEGHKIVRQWCKMRGLKKMVQMALNEPLMRVWKRLGFHIHRYLMVKEIE